MVIGAEGQAENAEGSAIVGPFVETSAVPLAPQPFAETVTARCTLPLPPAVKLMLGVPAPLVMVPFVIDQVYVAPTAALGTLATLPVESAQVELLVVIVA